MARNARLWQRKSTAGVNYSNVHNISLKDNQSTGE